MSNFLLKVEFCKNEVGCLEVPLRLNINSLKANNLPLTVEKDIFHFLGIDIERGEGKEITLRQTGLIDKVLKTVGMEDCHAKESPAQATPLGTDTDGELFSEDWDYASVVGMLLYLSSNSRPDIQFAVHQCARFTHTPRKSHAAAIRRICRYLKGTRDKGLIMSLKGNLNLNCYVDADFAGLYHHEDNQDPVCVKSRTGYVIQLGGCPLVWVSKLQREISLSTLEAEYIALSTAMRDLLPMKELLQEVVSKMTTKKIEGASVKSTVFEDNNSALQLSLSPKLTPRTKHIAVKYHFFKSKIGEDKGITIKRVDSVENVADIFTKGVQGDLYSQLRKKLMGW